MAKSKSKATGAGGPRKGAGAPRVMDEMARHMVNIDKKASDDIIELGFKPVKFFRDLGLKELERINKRGKDYRARVKAENERKSKKKAA